MRRLFLILLTAACPFWASGGHAMQEGAPAAHQHGATGGKNGKKKVAPECAVPDAAPSLRCAETPTPFFDKRGRLWLAWTQNAHVYVANSSDGGGAFTSAARVTHKPMPIEKNGENRPKVVVSANGEVYVTFAVKGEGRFTGIVYFSRSLDGGKSFSQPILVSDEEKPTSQRFETVQVDEDGRIHLAWIDKRDRTSARKTKKKYTGAAIYYAYSDDRGKSFSANRKLVDHSCECCRTAMTIAADRSPVMTWRHIFGKNIRDHALMRLNADGSPGPLARVSEDLWALEGCPHHGPAISVGNDAVLHVVWFTAGAARKGLFHARSDDGGKTFSPPFGFGNRENRPSHPYVLAGGGRVFVTWKEFSGELSEVFVMESPDNGRTWSAPLRVAATADTSDHPLLLHDGRWLYTSWSTMAEGWRLFKVAYIGDGAP